MPNRNRMTVDCSVEGPGIKDTVHLGFVLSSDFNDFFWEMYNLCVWREVILNNWAFPLMIFNSCEEWPSSPQASPCTLQCAKDAAHWRDWWVSSNNISNIKKHLWKHFSEELTSSLRFTWWGWSWPCSTWSEVLELSSGSLSATKTRRRSPLMRGICVFLFAFVFVVHKDEDEISVDERWWNLCMSKWLESQKVLRFGENIPGVKMTRLWQR